MVCRLELWIDGALCDEEWPCGRPLLEEAGQLAPGTAAPVLIPGMPAPRSNGAAGSCFTDAEGWKPAENVFVGDCMPYADGGAYHVLYLKDRRHHGSKWGLGAHQWEHVSTEDFTRWRIHPTAVAIDDPMEGSICTGSWIRDGERRYLFYTVRMADGSPAPVCRSVSPDGEYYCKDRAFRFTLSEKYHGRSARDPKVIRGEDGRYHMFVTTALTESGRGCLAHLTSGGLDRWTEAPEPLYVSADREQPECPDYFYRNGWYYLIFSLCGQAEYLYSDRPFAGWRRPENPAISCGRVPKMAVWQDRLIFTGFRPATEDDYAGTLTFLEARQRENGELEFFPLA